MNNTKNAIILVLIIVIIGGLFYYQNKENIDNNKITEAVGEAKINRTTSRDAYENMKSQLPHHFTACFATEKLSCTRVNVKNWNQLLFGS